MPSYPYRCADCQTPWSEDRPGSEYRAVATCPQCGLETTEQDFTQKRVGGYVNKENAWSEGKLVPQLHPRHPDRMVTSKKQMEEVYRKHGISMETGHFVSKEAQIQATVPRKMRTSPSTSLEVGGVIEEK
tara:strand:- start:465 stop:854 length:390 start_codon:yes stop_codon:yes gene_type:complete